MTEIFGFTFIFSPSFLISYYNTTCLESTLIDILLYHNIIIICNRFIHILGIYTLLIQLTLILYLYIMFYELDKSFFVQTNMVKMVSENQPFQFYQVNLILKLICFDIGLKGRNLYHL